MARRDDAAVAQDGGALQAVLQLAHVARPRVGLRAPRTPPRRASASCPAARLGVALDEVTAPAAAMSSPRSRSGGTVIGMTDRRKKRSSRKLPLGHRLPRLRLVAATIRTSTRKRRGAADALELARSSSTRRIFAWMASGSSPISSRKSVPPWASSNRPSLRWLRAGERALLVAEELGLEQRLGNRGAVDGDERPVGAVARGMQRAREQFLAGAALALRAARWCRLPRRAAWSAWPCAVPASSPMMRGAPRRSATSCFQQLVFRAPGAAGPWPARRPVAGARGRPAWRGSRARPPSSPRRRPARRHRRS